ncbi:hypothetical protein FD723_37580 (plasmid) [Nostoc sp. C052]|uniref:hypothetical protein n=1 Tax=Nostoc sp. C052 TaxID=2576902 RepID=UPI0015C36832|nr:hypothetical protein [Nostoc sp. C052]QLE45946.1 hypothetical protein FD723_37580 [Nostoc sp. C052]
MPYSKFTLSKAVEDFHLTIVEGDRFLPDIPSVTPTALLQEHCRSIQVGGFPLVASGVLTQ